MQDKITRLKKGNKIEVYDKNLVSYLQEQVGLILFARQSESHFEVWIPSNKELQLAFVKWCKVNNFNEKDHKTLLRYIKEAKVIWRA